MWSRQELKARAKDVLRATYWKAFLVSIVIAIVGGGSGALSGKMGGGGNHSPNTPGSGGWNNWHWNMSEPHGMWIGILIVIIIVVLLVIVVSLAFRIFLGMPLEVGGRSYFKQAAQGDADMNNLGFAFKRSRYMDIVKAMLWRALLNTLWYLLLIIPGIVKTYAYQMVPYILADNPNIGYRRALELSKRMTRGHKFRMWVLDLSFIGWYLLGALAFGVGILFVLPYDNATKAELYLELRGQAMRQGLTSPEELMTAE